MRSFILLLKRIGLQKIVAVIVAVVLIVVASVYIINKPEVLDPELQTKFNQGKYTENILEIEKWLVENPNDVNAMEVLAASYIQKAANEPLTETESLRKAMNLLGSIVKMDTGRDESFRLLGTAYLMKENPKLAAVNFTNAIRISKNSNLDALAGLAMVHEFNKDWEKAFIGYRATLNKNSKNESANLGVARYYISKNEGKKAMDYAWVVANSSSNNASLGEAYAILGAGMKLIGQPNISKTYFEKSLSYRPNNVHTLVLLGEAYVHQYSLAQKDDRQSVLKTITDTADKAIKLNPNYIHGYTLLYKVLLLQNKYTEANTLAKKIVVLLARDTTLTSKQKAEYKKFYSGDITSVKINSVKVINTNE